MVDNIATLLKKKVHQHRWNWICSKHFSKLRTDSQHIILEFWCFSINFGEHALNFKHLRRTKIPMRNFRSPKRTNMGFCFPHGKPFWGSLILQKEHWKIAKPQNLPEFHILQKKEDSYLMGGIFVCRYLVSQIWDLKKGELETDWSSRNWNRSPCRISAIDSVDGRNLAPVDMVNISFFAGLHTCHVLIAGFLNHQQFHSKTFIVALMTCRWTKPPKVGLKLDSPIFFEIFVIPKSSNAV